MSDEIKKVIRVDADTREAESGLDHLENKLDNLDTGNTKVTQSTEKLGEANKLTAKKIKDNAGAISTLDSLTDGLATKTKDLAESTELFNFSLKGTKKALLGLGLGIFLVTIGLIISYWADIVEFVTKSNAKLKEQNKILQDGIDLYEIKLKTLKLEAEILKEHGDSLDDNIEKQKVLLNNQLASAYTLAQTKKELLEIAKVEAERELRATRSAGRRNKRLGKATQTEFDKETKKKISELTKEAELADQQVKKLTLSIIKLLKEEDKPKGGGKKEKNDDKSRDKGQKQADETETILNGEYEKQRKLQEIKDSFFLKDLERDISRIEYEERQTLDELERLQASEELKAQIKEEYQNRIDNTVKEYSDRKKQSDEEIAQAEIDLDNEKLSAKLDTMGKIGDGLSSLSELAGKETAAGKALSVAVATIDTIQSAVSSYKSLAGIPIVGPALGGVAAAAAIAAGRANVKKILAVKVPNSSGGGGNVGASAPIPPQFNLVGTSGTNQLAESINKQQNEPVKAYVVSDDITTAQSLDRNRINNSTFL